MAVSESDRHHLYDAATTGRWDARAGLALMELLPPVGWADVATKQDLRSLGNELRAEIGGLRSELTGEIGSVRAEIGSVRGEIGGLRSELMGEIAELRGETGLMKGELLEALAGQARVYIATLGAFLLAGAGVAIATAQLVS